MTDTQLTDEPIEPTKETTEEKTCQTCAYSTTNGGICPDEQKKEKCKGEDYRRIE